MSEDEGRLVLAVQITAELQRAMTLRTIHEDRDCEEIVPDGQLATGEDRPPRDAVLMLAPLQRPPYANLSAAFSSSSASVLHW